MTKLEIALDKYYEKFDENYPLMITAGLSDDEIIADINKCIESNTTAEKPQYEDDLDY